MPDDPAEMALLLVRLGHDSGGRVDPDRLLRRPATSQARRSFMEAQDAGWLDGAGWVTDAGLAALRGDET